MRAKTLPILVLGALLAVAGCTEQGRLDFDRPAGAGLDGGEFGNATMNNHLAMSCQARYAGGKYSGDPQGGTNLCPPRTQDGKYAKRAYDETIESATDLPNVTTSISVRGGAED
jgi:hypothetical protein